MKPAFEIATAVLEHPLARRLEWQTIRPVMALRAGVPSLRPAQALRPTLVAINAAEITVGMEVRP